MTKFYPTPYAKHGLPNPQGKGLSPILDSLSEYKRLSAAAPKHITQVSTELFTSLFILESQIRFKPVVERSYWLYYKNGSWQLSMISPEQWHSAQSGEYFGECRLLRDLTWSLALSDNAAQNAELMALLDQRRQDFEQQLNSVEQLQASLPVYVDSFSFYSRVLASGLAYSLGSSMQQTGIASLNHAQALQQQTLALVNLE